MAELTRGPGPQMPEPPSASAAGTVTDGSRRRRRRGGVDPAAGATPALVALPSSAEAEAPPASATGAVRRGRRRRRRGGRGRSPVSAAALATTAAAPPAPEAVPATASATERPASRRGGRRRRRGGRGHADADGAGPGVAEPVDAAAAAVVPGARPAAAASAGELSAVEAAPSAAAVTERPASRRGGRRRRRGGRGHADVDGTATGVAEPVGVAAPAIVPGARPAAVSDLAPAIEAVPATASATERPASRRGGRRRRRGGRGHADVDGAATGAAEDVDGAAPAVVPIARSSGRRRRGAAATPLVPATADRPDAVVLAPSTAVGGQAEADPTSAAPTPRRHGAKVGDRTGAPEAAPAAASARPMNAAGLAGSVADQSRRTRAAQRRTQARLRTARAAGVAPVVAAASPAGAPPALRPGRAVHRIAGAGLPLEPGKVRVIYRDGRELTPCDRKKAEQEVALGRAKWVGRTTIRLRYDPFRARRIRRRILDRDGGVCAYCGVDGDTIDHLVPWSLGGRTTMDNCVASCAECNFRRGNRPVRQFLAVEGITVTHPMILQHLAQEAAREGTSRPERDAEGRGGA